MNTGRDCFSKSLTGVDYVFHTAAPFFSSLKLKDCEEGIQRYHEATQTLVQQAI